LSGWSPSTACQSKPAPRPGRSTTASPARCAARPRRCSRA
jgi:hypothetical protein